MMPAGNANGPGSETGCKTSSRAKYCHNYFQFYIPTLGPEGSSGFTLENVPSHNLKQHLDGFTAGRESPRILFDASQLSLDVPFNPINKSSKFDRELDTSKLVNLYDLLVERSSYFRGVETQLRTLYEDAGLFPQQQEGNSTLDQLVGLWLNLWLQVNFLNGVGEFGFSMIFPYQGMCFPSVCSVEDIEINSRIFGERFSIEGVPVISSPVMNEGIVQLIRLGN